MHFDTSQKLFEKAKRTLSGGVSSSLRTAMKPVPLFLRSGEGPRFTDVDGNSFIDYIMGYGPLILGHSHPELLQNVHWALQNGQQYGMQHEREIELSRAIVNFVPCADQVAFSGSGTEAVMLALRLARAYTGRKKIIRFEGHYHGWSDVIFTSFQSPDMVKNDHSIAGTAGQCEKALSDVILLKWNDIEALERTIRNEGENIAAVITEPVMCNSGCIHPRDGYLKRLRSLTKEHDIVLIFDEVITGFRVGPGGAQEKLGVTPDLTTMGKAIAGGFPLSVVAGKNDIMDLISNGRVAHLGTMNGNVLSMSAGLTTLNILTRNRNRAYAHMENIARQLVSGLKDIFSEKGLPHLINAFGPVFHLMFTSLDKVDTFDAFNERDADLYTRFAEFALQEGLAVRPNGLWYVSLAHTEREVEDTLEIVRSVAKKL